MVYFMIILSNTGIAFVVFYFPFCEHVASWYKHDTNATTDAKIRKLIIKYGAEGYAIYFHCLELIAADLNENNITFELEHDAEIIADNLKIKSTPECAAIDKVNEIMQYIIELNLFQESEGRIFCFKLLKRLDTSMTSSPKFRALIQKAKENHDEVMTDHDDIMQDKIRKDKIRKDKKEFIPPTLGQIKEYIEKESLLVDPELFITCYEENDWHDKYGNKVKNWKLKVRTWHNKEKLKRKEKDPYEVLKKGENK
jgi:hypothetical protein